MWSSSAAKRSRGDGDDSRAAGNIVVLAEMESSRARRPPILSPSRFIASAQSSDRADGRDEGDEHLPHSVGTGAVPGLVVTAALVPVIDAVTVSVAVIVWLPAVLSVTENVPMPLVSVLLAGRIAAPSAGEMHGSRVAGRGIVECAECRTVIENATPVAAVAGAPTLKWLAAAAETAIARSCR
jgi:hypothetical protein